MNRSCQSLYYAGDALFLMIGAVLIFSMHAGFAFLEAGTVRKKNQVNALVKILSDWGVSTVMYFVIGFPLAYGINFWMNSSDLLRLFNGNVVDGVRGFDLLHCFFLLTFAACIPAIISGGVAERIKFWPQVFAGAVFTGFGYPLFESVIWGRFPFFQNMLLTSFGAAFHDYAGSVVVHSVGGWIALPAIVLLGQRIGRWVDGKSHAIPISNIPFLSLGSWVLSVGWFGFNVMSAGKLEAISGLVAVNSLLAMVGGIIFGLVFTKADPGFVHNGALAGLIAICAGSDIVHPFGAFFIGGFGALLFIVCYKFETERLKIDDVLGVWPLHGITGSWGGIAAGIFGQTFLGGMGNVSFVSQCIGTVSGIVFSLCTGTLVYGVLKKTVGIRLDERQERLGSDLSIHTISAYPEDNLL